MAIANLPDPLVKIVLRPLVLMFAQICDGNWNSAWAAAEQTIQTYDPQNEAEFRLAARVAVFSIQAGEAIAQTIGEQMPLSRILRLQSGAVALSREAEKAENRLEKLRAARFKNPPSADQNHPAPHPTPGPTPHPSPRSASQNAAMPAPSAHGTQPPTRQAPSVEPPRPDRGTAPAPAIDVTGRTAADAQDDDILAASAQAHGMRWPAALQARQQQMRPAPHQATPIRPDAPNAAADAGAAQRPGTPAPMAAPTATSTAAPTTPPTVAPTVAPAMAPTLAPTLAPAMAPTPAPA